MTIAATQTTGPTACPTLHLHPLRRCNLACRHCYSSSSPAAADALTGEEALAAIRRAAAWGYRRLAISGGEPLLYPWLGECVALASGLGMQTALITNGLLAARPANLRLLGRIDVVAVSVDGAAATHNAIRGRSGAHAGVIGALAPLAQAGVDFGVVCGVCTANLDQIEEVAATAHAVGARRLQFHPITQSGRARTHMADASLSARDGTLLYVATAMLRASYGERLRIDTDLLHRQQALAHPGLVYAGEPDAHRWDRAPAELLGVLVVEPDGVVNPVCYGFAPAYRLGNLRDATLDQLWQGWLKTGYESLLQLGRAVLRDIGHGALPAVFNPSDILCSTSYRSASSGIA